MFSKNEFQGENNFRGGHFNHDKPYTLVWQRFTVHVCFHTEERRHIATARVYVCSVDVPRASARYKDRSMD